LRGFVYLEEKLNSYEPGVTAGFALIKITDWVGLVGTFALAAV
jgi:hypothetical protein